MLSGFLSGSEMWRWENFDDGFGGESENENRHIQVARLFVWERNLGMVIESFHSSYFGIDVDMA